MPCFDLIPDFPDGPDGRSGFNVLTRSNNKQSNFDKLRRPEFFLYYSWGPKLVYLGRVGCEKFVHAFT